ncbi:MAG: T9SS type A sorting domain-containing protein [Bacteroidales bacterium]|nr:T9SS type A sorting domain-containing protein [Bacteroidales bacterium]
MKKHLLFAILFCTTFSMASAQLFEEFEDGIKNSYAAAVVELASGPWMLNDALLGTLAGDKKNGLKSVRIRNGFIAMEFDHPGGLSEVSFYAANYGDNSGGVLEVSYSADGGNSWTALGNPLTLGTTLTQYTLQGSVQGNVRLRFEKTAGDRINVDDVLINDYIEVSDGPALLFRINQLPYNSGSTFNFGMNTGNATAQLQLRNTGEQELVIYAHQFSGTEFTVDGDLNVSLAPMESANFTLTFQAQSPGEKEELLMLTTNDPDNAEYIIYFNAFALDTSNPIAIADARQLPVGTEVTVTGWLTVAGEFGGPAYFQDHTAGIAWYNGAVMANEWLVGGEIGDSIVVTGELGRFNNLVQIVNDTYFETFPYAHREIEPIEITIAQMNSGDYEGWLVNIPHVEFETTGVFAGNTNYIIHDGAAEGELRVDDNTNIAGNPIPTGPVAVTGPAGRFVNTHQILPRFTQDIEPLSGAIILSAPPFETAATPTSISFAWQTEHAGHSEIRYGTTPSLELGKVMEETHTTSHQLTLTGLEPATLYKVQLRSAFDADTSATALYITTTASPAGTTGEIRSYFNKDVAHALASFGPAQQNVNFAQKLIEYIDAAEQTAEFAFYNISGDVGESIAQAILQAHQRGVQVRVVASGHTGTPIAVVSYLQSQGIRTAQSWGAAQMHNKFAVFDAHHSEPTRPHVITSSWNATDQGTHSQYQNMVIIQDVALARAYLKEFNQMWGGTTGDYNAALARFSDSKLVVNPSVFWIGEDQTRVEVFFSPQSNAEAHMNRVLSTAQESIHLALNLITRRSLANTIRQREQDGVVVRGVIGSTGEQGSQFSFLSSWADVLYFPQGEFGLLHHKYAIIDGKNGGLDSKVITGSHNWSSNANFTNDENTIIIYNSRVANEYFQEFAARYWQAGGQAQFEVTTTVEEYPPLVPSSNESLRVYPNPFTRHTQIAFTFDRPTRADIRIYDLTGRQVALLSNNQLWESGSHTLPWDAFHLPQGIYICRMQTENSLPKSLKLMLMR